MASAECEVRQQGPFCSYSALRTPNSALMQRERRRMRIEKPYETNSLHLRYDAPRRGAGRGPELLGGGQDPRRAEARRVRRPLHRGRLAWLESPGRRVLPGDAAREARARRSWRPSVRRGAPASRLPRTPVSSRWRPQGHRSRRSSARPGTSMCSRRSRPR